MSAVDMFAFSKTHGSQESPRISSTPGAQPATVFGQVRYGTADQMSGNVNPNTKKFASGESVLCVLAFVKKHQHGLANSPSDRGNCRNVQTLVNVGAAGVVDSRDDSG